MEVSKEGLAFIIGWEGMCPNPYLDDYPSGTWTIGIGITGFDGVDVKSYIGKPPQTMEEIVSQFKQHIKRYSDAVSSAIKRPIPQYQFDALVAWHYNTGRIASSDLTKLVNAKATDRLIVSWLTSHYVTSNGHVMKGLINRRKAEGEMFSKGKYGDGTAIYMLANTKGKQLSSTAKSINVIPYL